MNRQTTLFKNRFAMFELMVGFIILLFVTSGCTSSKWQAWGGVVANDVENQVDEILGKERVIREQAVQAVNAAQADVARLQELAVSSQVDAEMLSEKLVELRTVEADSKLQLGQLAQMVEARTAIQLANGSVWQPAELESYAETKVLAHQTLVERISVLEESIRVQHETSARATAALTMARQNVTGMSAALELLDAKIALLQAVEAQPTAIASGDPAVTGLLGETETLIDSLMAEVEREIRIAKGRQELQAPISIDVDSLKGLPSGQDGLINQLYSLSRLDK